MCSIWNIDCSIFHMIFRHSIRTKKYVYIMFVNTSKQKHPKNEKRKTFQIFFPYFFASSSFSTVFICVWKVWMNMLWESDEWNFFLWKSHYSWRRRWQITYKKIWKSCCIEKEPTTHIHTTIRQTIKRKTKLR